MTSTTYIVNKTLYVNTLQEIDGTNTVYKDCLIFVKGVQRQTPIEVINTNVLVNCIVVYQPSTSEQTMQPQVIAVQNNKVFTDDGDTPELTTLSGRVLSNNFICTYGNTIGASISLAAYGLNSVDFVSFYNLQNTANISLNLTIDSQTQDHAIILEYLYKNLDPIENTIIDTDESGSDIKVCQFNKTNCLLLLKNSMPNKAFYFQDNIILQNIELVDGCELHISTDAADANITVQSLTYKGITFQEQQALLGLKSIICKNNNITFIGTNEQPFNPKFKTIINVLSTCIDVQNCTANNYIDGKLILSQ